jgi:hypothetical protein
MMLSVFFMVKSSSKWVCPVLYRNRTTRGVYPGKYPCGTQK